MPKPAGIMNAAGVNVQQLLSARRWFRADRGDPERCDDFIIRQSHAT
jgi:hypothetical protein